LQQAKQMIVFSPASPESIPVNTYQYH